MLLLAASMLLCVPATALATHDATQPDGITQSEVETGVSASDARQAALEETLGLVRASITDALAVDLSAYQERLAGYNLKHYSSYAACAGVFADMANNLTETVRTTVEQCMPVLSARFREISVPLNPPDLSQFFAPDWRCIAALYYSFGDAFPEKLSESIKTSFVDGSNGGMALTIAFGTQDEIAAGGDLDEQMHVKFAYAYLNTVYDDDGVEKLTQKHVYPAGYLDAIVHPLPGCLIKNCWFDPRDGGKRLHTGADIRANGKTPILSVTDGVVTYIGTLPVPGNYVVVLDPYGYEYHYYHMFERSKLVAVGDTVHAGDPIGRVGNTGNSAANHLHLAIISPEHTYLNPYDLFVQAGIGPIRPEE